MQRLFLAAAALLACLSMALALDPRSFTPLACDEGEPASQTRPSLTSFAHLLVGWFLARSCCEISCAIHESCKLGLSRVMTKAAQGKGEDDAPKVMAITTPPFAIAPQTFNITLIDFAAIAAKMCLWAPPTVLPLDLWWEH